MGEVFAKIGGLVQVVDPLEGVVVAEVSDPGPVELASEPLAPVDVNLELIRHPALDADMHEAELVVDEVEVVRQASPLAPEDLQLVGLVALLTMTLMHGSTAEIKRPDLR